MKMISDIGEFGLIDRIRKARAPGGGKVLLGIGDDAAALRLSPGHVALATTDTMVEGTHFDLGYATYGDLGWKAMASSLSDIAAMGGRPLAALVSLTMTGRQSVKDVDGLYRGLRAAAARFGTALAGGDIVRGRELSVTVAVIGECRRANLGLRSGARPGDAVLVTGTLGASRAGLELLRSKSRNIKPALTRRHLRPDPRVREGLALADRFRLRGMIDISDGLASEVHHLSRESGVSVVLDQGALPVAPEAVAASARLGTDPMEYCLNGGEEYELLFTLPPSDAPASIELLWSLGTPCSVIGQARKGRGAGIIGRDGKMRPLEAGGYRHF